MDGELGQQESGTVGRRVLHDISLESVQMKRGIFWNWTVKQIKNLKAKSCDEKKKSENMAEKMGTWVNVKIRCEGKEKEVNWSGDWWKLWERARRSLDLVTHPIFDPFKVELFFVASFQVI